MRTLLYILDQLTDSDVEWLARIGTRRRCPRGTELIRCGEPLWELFILLGGEVSIRTGNGVELARIGVGEMLGEMSLVDTLPPSASAVVSEDAQVLSLDRAMLHAKLEADTGFAARFYRAIATFISERMRSTVARIGNPEATPVDPAIDPVEEASPRVRRLLHVLMG